MSRIDILVDDNGELQSKNNDILTGVSDVQHVADMIAENVGQYKEFPLFGVGVVKYLNSPSNINEVQADIDNNLKSDGYPRGTVKVSNNNDTFTFKVTID